MIELKNFTDLNQEEITLIWQWRNDDHVAFFMINKNIKWQEHINFIEKLKQDQTKKYFLVFQNDQIIGVIDFVNITKSSCEFGLYAKPDLKGVGQILMDQIKKYAFENLKVQKLKTCVFKDNEKALKLYQKNGFVITKKNKIFVYICLKNHILNLTNSELLFIDNLKNKKKETNKEKVNGKVELGGGIVNITLIKNNITFNFKQNNKIILKNYINLSKIEKEKIRSYRNHPKIKTYFYHTHFISKLEHTLFIKNLKYNINKSYYCIKLNKTILGSINFKIKQDNTIEFGFYANPFLNISGIGRILEKISIYYAFNIKKTNKLSLEVFASNHQVINLHKKFGFKIIQEYFFKNQKIFKMSLNISDSKTLIE